MFARASRDGLGRVRTYIVDVHSIVRPSSSQTQVPKRRTLFPELGGRVQMKRFVLPAAALFMAACQDAAAPPAGNVSPPLKQASSNSVTVPDRYIVVLRPEVQDVVAVARSLVATHGGSYDRVYTHALKGFAVTMPEAVARALAASPLVSYVEQVQVMQ